VKTDLSKKSKVKTDLSGEAKVWVFVGGGIVGAVIGLGIAKAAGATAAAVFVGSGVGGFVVGAVFGVWLLGKLWKVARSATLTEYGETAFELVRCDSSTEIDPDALEEASE